MFRVGLKKVEWVGWLEAETVMPVIYSIPKKYHPLESTEYSQQLHNFFVEYEGPVVNVWEDIKVGHFLHKAENDIPFLNLLNLEQKHQNTPSRLAESIHPIWNLQ